MFSETAYNSQTKLIGLNLHVSEHGIGYSNLTPDPQGAHRAPGVKIQVSPNQKIVFLNNQGNSTLNKFWLSSYYSKGIASLERKLIKSGIC